MHKVILDSAYGSRLYGTATRNSDYDRIQIVVPDISEYIVSSVNILHKKVENGETIVIPINKLASLAMSGESMAIDCLHVQPNQATIWTESWEKFHEMRSMFYTNRMKALIGYASAQVDRYSNKVNRLKTAEDIRIALIAAMLIEQDATVGMYITKLLEYPHVHLTTRGVRNSVTIFGKTFYESTPLSDVIRSLTAYCNKFGTRVRSLRNGSGKDWKAVSHAFRAAYVVKHIFTDKDVSYPLPETEMLCAIKNGSLNVDAVLSDLERLIEEVEILSTEVQLPDSMPKTAIDHINNMVVQTVLSGGSE